VRTASPVRRRSFFSILICIAVCRIVECYDLLFTHFLHVDELEWSLDHAFFLPETLAVEHVADPLDFSLDGVLKFA
jgi:hypothetical protein